MVAVVDHYDAATGGRPAVGSRNLGGCAAGHGRGPWIGLRAADAYAREPTAGVARERAQRLRPRAKSPRPVWNTVQGRSLHHRALLCRDRVAPHSDTDC